MTATELSGAIVRLRTKDEYDGMLGKVQGMSDEGDRLMIKHRPIIFPHRRDTTVHCFRLSEIEIVRA